MRRRMKDDPALRAKSLVSPSHSRPIGFSTALMTVRPLKLVNRN